MRIYHIFKLLREGFCCSHKWRQTDVEEDGQQTFICTHCGKKETRTRSLTLHILLPDQFTGNIPENK